MYAAWSWHGRLQPDLPLRLRKNLPLALWDRQLFYLPEEPHGYIDYPSAETLETARARL